VDVFQKGYRYGNVLIRPAIANGGIRMQSTGQEGR